MMQMQSHDEVGFIEIEKGGAVFLRDRDGAEHYVEWDDMSTELQEFLSRFIDDAEDALDEAIGVLQGIVSEEDIEEQED